MQTSLQKLSCKRNWGLFMIAGMVGSLKYLKVVWPTLHIRTALLSLEEVEMQMDTEWWNKKLEVQAQEFLTDASCVANKEQQNGNT